MPKSKQYEDAMGSVFDFIFTQSQQKPSKVKPVSPTGVDGSSEYIDALAAVLENPLLFVNKTSMDAFQEAANVNVGAFQVGKSGTDKIKINLNDLKDALSNPSEFIDKRYKKLEDVRKFTRLSWTGEEMKGILGGVWARSKGLDFQTQQALIGSAKTGADGGLHTGEAFVNMAQRNSELMEKHFGSGVKKLTKDDFERIYGKGSDEAKEAFKKYEKAFSTFKGKKDTGEAAFNRDVYSVLEGLEIREKAANASSQKQKEGYEAAANMIENTNALQNARDFIKKQTLTKRSLLDEIEQLKNIPGNQKEIDERRKELRIIDMNLRDANQFRLGERLGEFEGSWSTFKNYTVGGALLPSILDRSFFDEGKNQMKWLQPSRKKELLIGQEWDSKQKKFVDIKMVVHMGKEHKNKFVQSAYDQLNSLYYLSPATWVESLYTGEIFAFWAEKGRSKFQKSVESIISKKIGKFKLDEKFLESLNQNDKKIMDLLEGKLSATDMADIYKTFPSLEKLINDPKAKKMLQKFLKSDSSLRNLTNFFNMPTRFKDSISKKLNEVFGKKVREKIGNALLNTALIKKFGTEAIKLWMKNGGIQLLVKTLVTSIATAIGLGAGPVGSAIANVLAFLAMDLVYAVTKPLMKGALVAVKVVLFAILGMLAFVAVLIYPFFDTHSGIAPTEVKYCTAAGVSPIIDPENDPNDPTDDIKPGDLLPFQGSTLPSGEECLLGDGAYNCTQGAFGTYSHNGVAAIDLTGVNYFHAPSFCDNGNCEITYSGPINCTAGYAGGLVKLKAEYEGNTYEFKLIHVDTKYSVGDKISGGEAVARVMEFSETGNACSSGKHLHLETKFNGSSVNPYDMMTSGIADGGFACPISLCP